MEQIYYLKNIKVRSLDIDSKILIQIYKLFFDENPDFSSKDINLKIQAMLSILAEFGITLGIDYDFKRNKNNIPFSCEIKDLVDELYPFGEIDTIKDNIELDSESIKIIKVVGKYIRETISNTQNPICSLQNISKAIYVVKYCVFSNDDIYELAKITNCDSSEVMECFKLKRIIEENIYKK